MRTWGERLLRTVLRRRLGLTSRWREPAARKWSMSRREERRPAVRSSLG